VLWVATHTSHRDKIRKGLKTRLDDLMQKKKKELQHIKYNFLTMISEDSAQDVTGYYFIALMYFLKMSLPS
jgi:hypothetical protein